MRFGYQHSLYTRSHTIQILFSYFELAAHFLVGFDETVLVVEHDAVMVSYPWVQPKSDLHLVFLIVTSQGSWQRTKIF